MRTAIPAVTALALASTLVVGCGARSTATGRPSATLAAATSSPGGTVTTTGTGTATAVPDTLSVQIGVHHSGATVGAALGADNSGAAAVQAALEDRGVAVTDIQTTGLSVYAQRHGYAADDTVGATIRDLPTAGSTIDAALAAAGDAGRLDGVSFSVSDQAPALGRARSAALAASRTAAEQLAAASGRSVTGLRSITENDADPGSSAGTGSAASGSTGYGSPVPVQAGSEQIQVQVTVVWSLGG